MSSATQGLHPDEKVKMGALGDRIFKMGIPAGILLLGIAALLGSAHHDHMRRFFHSYLLAVSYVTTFAVGALFFVIIQHLTRARWSVVVRRVAEILSNTFPIIGILVAAGILIPLMAGNHQLYPWSNPEFMKGDHVLEGKAGWLNPAFFTLRIVLYFAIWTGLARYFMKKSVEQDVTGDAQINERLRVVAAPSIIIFAFTTAGAGIDLLMTLDPKWYSTMWPVYFFAGSVVAIMALLAVVPMILQRTGRMVHSVTVEHYHDIGKLLFGFLMFWGYIAFSQFMLQWYGNLPEETEYFNLRMFGSWQWLSYLLLFGHFAFPYLCLLTRETKRRKQALAFFACWLLLMHAFDLYWVIMPQYGAHAMSLKSVLMDLLALGGAVSIFAAAAAREASKVDLIPAKDPGLGDSLRFENF